MLGCAFWWPCGRCPALAVSTMSLMVAARNFQVAWLMRSMGEEAYRDWYLDRLLEAPASLYLLCLAGQSLPVAAVGGALMWFSDDARVIWLAPLGGGPGAGGLRAGRGDVFLAGFLAPEALGGLCDNPID